MHYTVVKLKNGEEYSGPIEYFRPFSNWFSLFGIERRFNFDECESVVTPDERVSINSPMYGEVCDEMKRAKKDLDDGRKYSWVEDGVKCPTEKFGWEALYE